MDEPKESPARASGFVIPIALALVIVGYVWTETAQEGSVTLSFSRLLGFRIEGHELPVRQVVGMMIVHSPAFVLALAVFRRTTAKQRAFVFGAAALLGFIEVLLTIAIAVVGEVLGLSIGLTGAGAFLLIIGALGALERIGPLEIRATEGGRA